MYGAQGINHFEISVKMDLRTPLKGKFDFPPVSLYDPKRGSIGFYKPSTRFWPIEIDFASLDATA